MIKYPSLIVCVRDSGVVSCFRQSKLSAIADVLCRSGSCEKEEYSSKFVYDLLTDSDFRNSILAIFSNHTN